MLCNLVGIFFNPNDGRSECKIIGFLGNQLHTDFFFLSLYCLVYPALSLLSGCFKAHQKNSPISIHPYGI